MKERNLFEKVWDAHAVGELSNGQTQLFVGRHLIHEVTSPQAFGMLREKIFPFYTLSAPLQRLITSCRRMKQANPIQTLLPMQ